MYAYNYLRIFLTSVYVYILPAVWKTSPGGAVVKNLPASAGHAGDVGSVPGPGRSPGIGNDNPLQCSCLERSTDRGAWRLQSMGLQKVGHH